MSSLADAGGGQQPTSTATDKQRRATFSTEEEAPARRTLQRSHTNEEPHGPRPLQRSMTSSCCSTSKLDADRNASPPSSFHAGVNQRSRMLRSQHTVSNLLAFADKTTREEKEEFKLDVHTVRKRIHQVSHRTLDPRSKFIRRWDLIIICALTYTAFVTPFEVAFFEPALFSGNFNFFFNRLTDLIFVADIMVNFFLPYRETQRKGGMMVYDNRKIMRNYLRGWFGLDVFTVIPFDLIFTGVASAARVTVDANMFRLLRMLRLLKLARILRASRIISRWQDHIAVSFALMSLVKFSFLIMVLAHWLACAWGFVGAKWSELPEAARASAGMGPAARSNESDGGSPKADLGTWTGYHTEMTWRQKAGVPDTVNEYELYGISLYVALNNIFGGSCEIHPGNYPEFYVQAVMLLTGSSVWAYVIGSACGIIATLDPSRIEFRQTLDELNYFCREQCLPEELAVKLRSYFRNTMHLIRSRRYDALLQKMSVRLRGDAAFRMCEFRLRSVPFLVHPDLEPEFMCNLAIKYNTNVYSRLERVPCSDLFVVERGVVAKHGKLGVAGTCFGKDVILANEALRDIGDAIALTFVQTISLTQRDIFDLLPDYPMAYVIVRKAALRMALIRALVKAARLITRSHSGLANSSMMHIFDSAMREAHDEKQARIDDERQKREAQIPLTLKGTASLEGLKATMQQARRKRAQQEAAKAGGTKKKGWGKLSLHVATGELSKDVPPAKIKSPIVEAEIDRDWALKLNSKASPELSGSFKGGAGSGAGSSACDPNLMQSVQELKAQMDQAHNDSMEVQNATLQRIALLEAALTQTLKQVAVKLEEAAKRPQSFVVRQKRGMIVKNREALAAGEQAQTTPSLSREGTSSDIAPAASLVAGAQVHASPAEVRVAQPPQPPSYQGRRSPELQEALSMESTGNSLSRSHPSDENGVLDA